jgi:DNA-binding winged helix-turn-helix (wHTH) protein
LGGEIPGKFEGFGVNARFGPFVLDSGRRALTRDGDEVHLTPKAFDLLGLLVDEAPRVVRKTELHERLWPGTFVSDATLVGLVKELRRALNDREASAPMIRTAHGVGYAFTAQIDRAVPRGPTTSRWIVAGSRRIALPDGEHVIGRDPASAIWLDVAGVSRHHARIAIGDGGTQIEDLGSKNGTRVGDVPLTTVTALHDGDRIHVGPIFIVYHCSASGMSTETVDRRPPPPTGGAERS